MKRAVYIGTAHPELIGKTALIKKHPEESEMLLAQFDELDLAEPEEVDYNHHTGLESRYPGVRWGLGWHGIPKSDMRVLIRIGVL